MSPPVIEPGALVYKTGALNQWNTVTAYTITRFRDYININTRGNTCIEFIMVWCVHAKFCTLLQITSTLVKKIVVLGEVLQNICILIK